MGITIFPKKNPCNKHNNIDKRGCQKREFSTRIFTTEQTKTHPKDSAQCGFFLLNSAAIGAATPDGLVTLGDKQSRQSARAAPPSPAGLSYTSEQSLQSYAQKTGDW